MESCAAARQQTGRLWRQGEEIAEVLLRGVRIQDFILDDIGENFSDISGQRRLIVAPPPDRHSRNTERARCSGVAAKRQLKGGFVLSAGKPTLKSR
jgi:hypothetical protein